MSLNLTDVQPGLVRLDPKKWTKTILNYVAARTAKKEADAASRSAESTVKDIRAALRDAMGSSPAALCGNAVLTVKSTAAAEATLTMIDGAKLAWKDVTGVMVGNRLIRREDILSLYGGRSASEDIVPSGMP